MTESIDDTQQVYLQAKLFTKIKTLSIPDTPLSLPIGTTPDELNALTKGLLEDQELEAGVSSFDFLIDGAFLTTSLQDYIEANQLSTESAVEIECVIRREQPELDQGLAHDDWVSSVDYMNELILTGSYDNTVSVWDLQGTCLGAVEGHQMPVKHVRWVAEESGSKLNFISASQDQTILVWQHVTGTKQFDCVHACKGHAASVDCLAVQPSANKFASGSWDKMIKVWNASVQPGAGDEHIDDDEASAKKQKNQESDKKAPTTRTPLTTLSGHKEPVSAMQWTSDTQLVSGGWDHCIRQWDVETATNTNTLTASKAILTLSHSPLNSLVATGSADSTIRLYDMRSSDGLLVKSTLQAHAGWVSAVCWSPTDEHQLMSGCYDNKVKVWDTRSAKQSLYDLSKHTDKVLCVSWPLATMLISGGADNNVNIHRNKNS